MLNEIRLDDDQLGVLEYAAGELSAELRPEYRGRFRPSGEFCVALVADRAGRLAQWLLAVSDDFPELARSLASRACDDEMGTEKVYYFPGVIAPAPGPVPAMLTVGGKRFACERCGATVFTRTGEVFACNGCGTEYAEPARAVTS